MRAPLQPGLVLIREMMVNETMLVPSYGLQLAAFTDMPPVLATAYMVAFAEATCAELVKPHLPSHQRTVGTRVAFSHVSATPRGMRMTADVELIEAEGRRLQFRIACRDEAGLIGEGLHDRAIIDVAGFMEKLAEKQARAALNRRSSVSPLSSRRASL